MPIYITLLNYTQQGIKNVKESPARDEAAKKAIQAMGGEIKQLYLTMGQYDSVAIYEAPNDETVATLLLTIGMQGNVTTQTMRAFTQDEYRKIIASLP
jgi:uncharacterized protein with GYD domain